MRSHHYFIADLHLDPDKKTSYQLALDFLTQARDAKALYILGDLFEYWIGDDAGLALYSDMIEALAALSANQCQLTVMLGNRDFLLGDAFAQAAKARLVREDELLIELDSEPVLLLHGDTLCTDDHEYQAFRQQVRNHKWQEDFLAKSINERLTYAQHLRAQSAQISADKSHELMDVNSARVQSRIEDTRCPTMIHGHTHRPFVHVNDADNTRRFVLGDWHPDRACYVVRNSTGIHLKRFTGQLDSDD